MWSRVDFQIKYVRAGQGELLCRAIRLRSVQLGVVFYKKRRPKKRGDMALVLARQPIRSATGLVGGIYLF